MYLKLKIILYNVFDAMLFFGVTYTFIAAFIDRFIVLGNINKTRMKKSNYSRSNKEAIENLEEYKKIVLEKNGSLFCYWYMFLLFKYGKKYVLVFFVLSSLVAIDMWSNLSP